MAGKIFISYRRSETAWAARALFERLVRRFPERVFIDLEGIELGSVFTEAIDRHLEGCHAMLALIGATWLTEIQDREAHGDEDYVRLELARSLARGIPIVPVLVDGAPMPRARDLPDDLKAVTRRNALPLVADTFEAQMGRLEREVHKILAEAGDLPITADPFASVRLQPEPVRPDAGVAKPSASAAPAIVRPRAPWMNDEGTDQYGRWAEFKVDSVIQRLRWIEPGEFWMGSTEAERRRFAEGWLTEQQVKEWLDPEKPRHRVRLTQGYWLADTACTQALWQAVTGDNPSSFTGDLQLPVENVSWNDITQHFLPELNRRVPGLQALLPNEAQWEFACRAGTDTAYAFGETITPEQVNFNGNYPPPGGAKDLFREKSVPVKALAANAWGLYQMHGNVSEWCADGKRTYEAGTVSDPLGPQDQGADQRVLRGGSWNSYGWFCRSAYRNVDGPVERYGDIGFRFARGLADQ
ncbi:MAG: hypothetical protein RL375_3005 [Pseudomonadota bacterium]